MPSEPMTPSSGGNDSAHPLSLDDAANLDFGDSSENTEEVTDEQQSNDEHVEATDDVDQETVEAADDNPETNENDDDAEDDGEGELSSTPEPADDATVTIDGKALTVAELKKGYFREADYTRRTQELATKRRDLEALSTRVTNSVNAIAELLTASVPKPPDERLLFSADPKQVAQYHQQKHIHDTAMARVAEVIAKANEPKDAANAITAEQRKEVLATENAKLAEVFPQTATPDGRKKFFESAASVARELGYSDEEIGQATDHRMFALAHYARIGMQAEAARAKAKQKVANVPPVAPNKRQPGQNANAVRKNQEAMKRLAKSGSIHDAMDIDF